MGQPLVNGQRSQISIGEFNILYSILAGQSIHPKENLKKFYHKNRSKNREEVLIDVVNRCLNSDFLNSQYIKNFIPEIFDYILQINSFSVEKGFIFTHFEKIILLGVNNQNVFIQVLLKIAEKLPKKYQKTVQQQEQISRYNYIKTKYPTLQSNLETIKELCQQQATNTSAFNAFMDFIYQSIKNDEKEIFDRQKKATDLLNAVALERQKKESGKQVELGVYDDNACSTVALKEPVESREITSKIANKRVPKNNYPKETVGWSDKLLLLKREGFSAQQVSAIEKEIKQAISDNKETVKAYNALTDLYLLCSEYNINYYNQHYKSSIIKNKEAFGTPNFDADKNRQVTQAIADISYTLENISQYLQQAQSTLKELVSLAGNNSFQLDNSALLQITSDTFRTLLDTFLKHLKDLNEWKSNKLNYIKKNNIVSKKSSTQKKIEREAFEKISHYIKSLDEFGTFIQEFLKKQQPYDPIKMNFLEQAPLEKTAVAYPVIINALLVNPDGGPQQLHQSWCIWSRSIPADCPLPAELLRCSC